MNTPDINKGILFVRRGRTAERYGSRTGLGGVYEERKVQQCRGGASPSKPPATYPPIPQPANPASTSSHPPRGAAPVPRRSVRRQTPRGSIAAAVMFAGAAFYSGPAPAAPKRPCSQALPTLETPCWREPADVPLQTHPPHDRTLVLPYSHLRDIVVGQ